MKKRFTKGTKMILVLFFVLAACELLHAQQPPETGYKFRREGYVTFGSIMSNRDNLNTALKDAGYPVIGSSDNYFFGAGIIFDLIPEAQDSNASLVSSLDFKIGIPENNYNNNSGARQTTLYKYLFSAQAMYLFDITRMFHVYPMISFGFEYLNLKLTDKVAYDFPDILKSDYRSYNYSLGSFSILGLGGGAEFIIPFSDYGYKYEGLVIGVNALYRFHIPWANETWTMDGLAVEKLPVTNLNGLSIELKIGYQEFMRLVEPTFTPKYPNRP